MFGNVNRKPRDAGVGARAGCADTVNVWERFVAACTETLGGFYRQDGTIFRDDEDTRQSKNLDFADLMQRTHLRMRHQETRRQLNLETITEKAYQQVAANDATREVDPDWLNLFFSYAQDVSTPAMRSLWASALSLEISKPGTISKHSLGYLRHCDAWELAAFRKVTTTAFIAANGHPFIFKAKGHVSNQDPIFTEPRLLSHCISAGLFAEQTKPLAEGFAFNYEGQLQVVRQHPFSCTESCNEQQGYYVQQLTRIGSDLYRLIIDVGLQASDNAKKRSVWEFLTDYLELGIESTC